MFYISQAIGDDSLSGRSIKPDGHGNGPYRTLERAIQSAKIVRQSGMEQSITIALLDDYFTSTPITIAGIDKLTVESYGIRRRIVGGVRISGWQESEFNGTKCYCAPVPKGICANFTDLFVNGERAQITRFPKEGKLKILDADAAMTGSHKHSDHALSSSKWFRFDRDSLSSLQNIEEAHIHYSHYWVDEHSPIESYDATSGTVTMAYSSRFSVSADYNQNPNAAPLCFLTNLPNCFGEPSHWYLDRKSRTVYYVPKHACISPDQIEACAPISDRLFIISGKDICLRHLELTCTKGEYASTKRYSSSPPDKKYFASDIQSSYCAPGAICLERSENCSIIDCTLHGVGIYGIEISKCCHNIKIEQNDLYDICAGGIRISGGSAKEEPDLATSHCTMRYNHIHDCGKRYLAGCGILITDANHCEISENEIHDMEYSGISVGWVWGYADSATYENRITKNHIYNIGKCNLSDLGGIYLLGKQQGTVVSQNIIHDIKCAVYGAWGIYLDEGSSYITVEQNLIYQTERESLHLHYGSHNTVRENVFLGKHSCVRVSKEEAHDQLTLEGNLLLTGGAPTYGVLLRTPKDLHTNRNILWDTVSSEPTLWQSDNGIAYSLSAWKTDFGNDIESIVAKTPDDALRAFGTQKLDYFLSKGFDIKALIQENM